MLSVLAGRLLEMGAVHRMLLLLLAGLALALGQAQAKQVPIVIWHGMGDSCYNDFSMGKFAARLESHLGEDAYVKLLCFGDNVLQDTLSGFFQDANKQVDAACRAIAEDERLKDGYHAVGLSQGGQFLRAVAQRCPFPQMKVLVSLGGQHQGVYGLPHCKTTGLTQPLCGLVRRLLSQFAYFGWVQHGLTQAQYWHDGHRPDRYRRGSTFLSDINNDLADPSQRNRTYADNLAKLEALVLVRFNLDTMVVPVESQWFEFYAPDSKEIDWIGLRALDETGRLVRLSVDCDHLRFSWPWFYENVVDKYLKSAD
ncbi:hypothetical protein FOCC_FOCC017255 [Frankliniella occidentalis]|nr:hypothetical protein FOCC_FOCC017255 [Frankliniella occidentalis]